ncbi:hypothetical protein [Sediminibacillus massiliensis]|uniref:hypothetical protein n=1 Tax=Sediminibacillus massiliensis TaxID=1926277 RepID=UPI0009883981|nr:hypothetical protein [Sediminibacillus massiliensis]
MIQRIMSTMFLAGLRFSLHLTVRKRSAKNRKKRAYKETVKTMKMLHEKLIEGKQLNEDFTIGPKPVSTKATKRVLAAFLSQKDKREDEDFYLYAAQTWVKDLDRKSRRTSIFFIVLFFVLTFGTIGLTQIIGGFGGTPALLILLCTILSPVLGIFHAMRTKGWQRWALIVINAVILYGFIFYFFAVN